MSTILDALKKSEQERRLSSVPTLSDMPTPQEPSRWPLVLLAATVFVLLILVVLVVYKVWFSGAAFSGSSSLTEGSSLAKGSFFAEGSSSTAGAESRLESASEETGPGSLVVNVVSFSAQIEKRFVMIDGKLLREGEFVRAGVKVEEIRQNEVVLNVRGEKVTRRP